MAGSALAGPQAPLSRIACCLTATILLLRSCTWRACYQLTRPALPSCLPPSTALAALPLSTAPHRCCCCCPQVQIIRIQRRVPEYGWTTQKVFHLLNFFVCGLRASVFALRREVQRIPSQLAHSFLLDLPGLLFFSTYTLLVLFWAEIYYQARSLPTDSLRPLFVLMNVGVYAIQIGLWVFCSFTSGESEQLVKELTGCFLAFVSAAAAFGFLVYGGRLFLMLRRFPIESRGRRKKLTEVGLVTSICATCFLFRWG